MTEATEGGCSGEAVGLEEKIGPYQCQSIDSEPRVGRMLFRGVNMVFLTVNGHQMFTLHGILEKLFPTTPRSTFCARVEKMNALRHVCTKHELQKLKVLGGAKPNAIKCTVIARKHVLEYCEKFDLQKNANQGKCSTSSEGINVRSCRKNWQGNGKASSVQINQFSSYWSNNTSVEDARQAAAFEDWQCRSHTNEVCKENIGNAGGFGGRQKEGEVSGKENGNSEKQNACITMQNIRHSKPSNSVSRWSSAGVISQPAAGRSIARRRASKQRRVSKKRGTVSSSSDSLRKPKQKTNLELVQVSCGKVADDNDTVKRQKTESRHHLEGNGKGAKRALFDRSFSLDSILPASSLTLDLEPWPEASTERSRAKGCDQALNGDKHECSQTTKCYLDNNSNEIQVPRSPTLLLKRSVNNKWHVAKSHLPRLNFDDFGEEGTLNGDDGSFLKPGETSPARSATNSTNSTIKDASLATVPVSEPKPEPSAIKSSPQSTKTLSSKVKKSVAVGHSVSTKPKKGRITAKKSEAKADEQAELWPSRTAINQGNRFGPDALVTTRNTNSGAKLIGNGFSGGAKSAESSRSVNDLNGKTLRTDTKRLAIKDKSNGSVQKAKSNKANAGVVGKQKRRRRVQFSTFRLIETIPYPSSLVVKDGDLCPSLTMTYSAANRLPHCCHPLWRWCLGKPVLQPRGSQIGKSNAGEAQKEESCVKRDSIGFENDDTFWKHGRTDDQPDRENSVM